MAFHMRLVCFALAGAALRAAADALECTADARGKELTSSSMLQRRSQTTNRQVDLVEAADLEGAPDPKEARAVHEFNQLDLDGDGKITKKEAERHPQLSAHFDFFDIDKDGAITPLEYYQDEIKWANEHEKNSSMLEEGTSKHAQHAAWWWCRGGGEIWRATSGCPWICRQGWFWQCSAYGKPACCQETKNSGSPYSTCQHETCACDAQCRGCCTGR
mmetsp:Transcript_56915/g.176569  ORF Transcript_56915/g.176569 Transcript_56915/m.176569 type:complete len:217 (-) Transcript_56915:171-821(-)